MQITCMHKLVCKDFEIKNWGKYNDFSINFDILLLADLFENFRKTCLEIYQLDPDKFLSAPGLACQVTLKKDLSRTTTINRRWYGVNGWKRK